MRLILVGIVGCIFLSAPLLRAGRDEHAKSAPSGLEPRPILLPKGEQSLPELIDFIYRETGNRVIDRRRFGAVARLSIDLGKVTFWQAVDAITENLRCGVSLYEPDAKLALVDRQPNKAPTTGAGIFRVAAKRLGLTKDLETNSHSCTIALDVAWEPRFEPFYLDVGPGEVVYPSGPNEAPRIEDHGTLWKIPASLCEFLVVGRYEVNAGFVERARAVVHPRIVSVDFKSTLSKDVGQQHGRASDSEVRTGFEGRAVNPGDLFLVTFSRMVFFNEVGQPIGLSFTAEHDALEPVKRQVELLGKPRKCDVVTRVAPATIAHSAAQIPGT